MLNLGVIKLFDPNIKWNLKNFQQHIKKKQQNVPWTLLKYFTIKNYFITSPISPTEEKRSRARIWSVLFLCLLYVLAIDVPLMAAQLVLVSGGVWAQWVNEWVQRLERFPSFFWRASQSAAHIEELRGKRGDKCESLNLLTMLSAGLMSCCWLPQGQINARIN